MSLPPVPDDAQSSPVDADWIGTDARWYKPDWAETARLLGWRWVYCLPLVLLIVMLVMIPALTIPILIYGWKLIALAVVLPLTAFGAAARKVVRNRKDPFCIHCGYSLVGLPDGHRCPECGQKFLLRVIDEYRRDPDFFIERHRKARSAPAEQAPFAAGPVRSRKSRDGT
jgi:hypothetical protein